MGFPAAVWKIRVVAVEAENELILASAFMASMRLQYYYVSNNDDGMDSWLDGI